MDDKPTNEEPKKDFNQLDLSDLKSLSFGTQWTQDKPEKGGGPRGRDDRPRRDGPQEQRKDRRGFKRPAGGPGVGVGGSGGHGGSGGPVGADNRPPRGERPPGPGGERRAGPDRRDGGGGRGPGGPGGPGGPRGDRRRGGPGGPGAYAPVAPYVSPYFEVTFYPEDVSFAALAKTIRASCRTFELFDIAKTVIGKNDRFVVVVERKPSADAGAEKRPFYVSVADGIPFETEDAAISHVMQHHLDKFFSSAEVEVDPPKGSFQVINRCGVTGELLGPPNYHLYSQIMQQHHAARLSRMPFDVFKSRIESVRETEVVDAWLETMKKVTRYTWLTGAAAAPAKASSETGVEVAEAPVAPEAAESVESEAAPEASVEETADAASTPVASAPTFDSLTEAKVYLLTHAREKAVRTYEHGRFHGHAIDKMPDGEIKRAVEGSLDRQQRFPLDTANALRGRLRREGFTIFKKGSKGVSYVCAVKRKFRVPGQTFADSIDELINYIETHPMVKMSELPDKFLGITLQAPAPVAPPPAPTETSAAAPGAPAPAAVPTAATVSPFSPEDQPRVKRMNLDLRWLVTEGYVTEFIDGSLFAAPPLPDPKAKTSPESKSARTPAAEEADDESPDAEPQVEPETVEEIAPEPEPVSDPVTEAVEPPAAEEADEVAEVAAEPPAPEDEAPKSSE